LSRCGSEKTLNKFNGDGPRQDDGKVAQLGRKPARAFQGKPEEFATIVARVEKALAPARTRVRMMLRAGA